MQVVPPQNGAPYALIEAGSERLRDFDAEIALQALKAHGAALLRGFDGGMDDFRALTSALCSSEVFNESPARAIIDRERLIQTVDLGVDAFPLHPELSREPFQPDACFFWCLAPPSRGGETTVCDGVEIVRRMPASLRAAFEGRTLEYRQLATPEVLIYWLGSAEPASLVSPYADCPYQFFVNPAGRIARSFTRPALTTPVFSEEPCWNNFILFAHYHLGMPNFPTFEGGEPIPLPLIEEVKAIADAVTAPIAWRKGDIAILDNWRVMHGRNAIEDARERLIASYFGYLRAATPRPGDPADPRWRRESFRPPHRHGPAGPPRG